MSLPPRAQRFRQDMAIVDPATGYPTATFLRSINSAFDLINYVATVQAAAAAAQVTADAAQGTADDAVASVDTLKVAQYIVIALSGALTNERVLTAGNRIGLADGGANNPLTVDVDDADLVTETGVQTLEDKILDALRVQDAFTAGAPTVTGSIPVSANGVTKYIMLADAP